MNRHLQGIITFAVVCMTPACNMQFDPCAPNAPSVEVLLWSAVPKKPWSGVPARYRGWAQDRLEQRIDHAAMVIAQGGDCHDVDVAMENVSIVTSTIAKVAKEHCTPEMCEGLNFEPVEVDVTLQLALCPGIFPFC